MPDANEIDFITWNVHAQFENFHRAPNATYIPLARVGILRWGWRKFYILRWLEDTNMLVSQTKNSGVGGIARRHPRRQVFCVAVEYRLNTRIMRECSSCSAQILNGRYYLICINVSFSCAGFALSHFTECRFLEAHTLLLCVCIGFAWPAFWNRN